MRLVQWEKRIFLKKVVFLPAYWYLLHCLSHPYAVSMQILHECTQTNVLGSSVKVSDRFIYVVENWLWQWKSRIQMNRVLDGNNWEVSVPLGFLKAEKRQFFSVLGAFLPFLRPCGLLRGPLWVSNPHYLSINLPWQ